MKTLDMTGKPCPIPVITAKKELEDNSIEGVTVLVDNIIAVQNLEKMARGMGYSFKYEEQGENFMVEIIKNQSGAEDKATESVEPASASCMPSNEGVTVLITSNQIGRGNEELGKILIKGFLFSMTELPVPPKAVIFMNSGVHLVAEGSNTVEDLRTLSAKGTKVLSCGTCLNFYSLMDKVAVGEVTDMFGIVSLLSSAARLITL